MTEYKYGAHNEHRNTLDFLEKAKAVAEKEKSSHDLFASRVIGLLIKTIRENGPLSLSDNVEKSEDLQGKKQ